MAYKFQIGAAVMSGSLQQEGSLEVLSDAVSGSVLYSVGRTGRVSGSSLLHNVGAVTLGSTLATSGNIDTAGDLTAATITMTGFSVDADGDTVVKTLATPDDGTIGNASNADLLTLAATEITVKANSELTIAGAGKFKLADGAVTSTAAELNKLDGAGADVTAAKLTTLSALTDSEIGFIDGAGTAVVASKVVVADSNKDVSSLRSLTGSADAVFTNGRFGGTKGAVVAHSSSFGYMAITSSLSSSGTAIFQKAATFGGLVNVSGNLQVDGTVVNFPNVAAAALDAADLILSLDSTTKDLQARTRTNFASDLAGVGLGAASGIMSLDLNELGAADVDVAADSIAIIDANDSNNSKKESIADLATAMAGDGISALNGVLSTDAAVSSRAWGADGPNTLVEGMNFGTGSISTEKVLTLPASPANNDIIRIKAPGTMNADVIIRRAGSQTIDGNIQVHLESAGAAISLQYVGSDVWVIF